MDDGRILPLNRWQVACCQDSSREPNSQGSGVKVNVMHPQTSLIIAQCRREGFREATSTRLSEAEIKQWGRYASAPCTSMLGDEVYNWKQFKDTVKWQKYWRYFVWLPGPQKINYSWLAHVLCHHNEMVLLVLDFLFHFLDRITDSSLPQKHSHFLFKGEAEVHHCNASSINIASSGVSSLPVQKKGVFMYIPMLWQWGVRQHRRQSPFTCSYPSIVSHRLM